MLLIPVIAAVLASAFPSDSACRGEPGGSGAGQRGLHEAAPGAGAAGAGDTFKPGAAKTECGRGQEAAFRPDRMRDPGPDRRDGASKAS